MLVSAAGPAGARASGLGTSPQSIYVSPSGNDSNPGTAAQPVQTISRAQALVRTLNVDMNGDLTVNLESGMYRLSAPLTLGPQDSGTNGFNVVWTAAPGATAVLGGGDRVTGWHLSDPSKDIWAAPVPNGLRTRQLYVNGMRASLAIGPPPVHFVRSGTGYTAATSVMDHWRNPTEIDFVWASQLGGPIEPICPVASIKGRSITIAQLCWNNTNLRGHTIVGWDGSVANPSYIENAYELLNQPGEFYVDNKAHIAYYIPRPGQDLATADVEAPALQSLVVGQGTPATPVHNITFSGLQFSYATWLQPSTPNGFSEQQAGYTFTGKNAYATEGLCHVRAHGTCPFGAWTKEPGNLQFSYDRSISFLNDRFIHLGAAGLNLDNGSQHDTIQGSVFTDISGNGIELGSVNMPKAVGASQTTDLSVIDNHIYGLPVEYVGGVGILAGYIAGSAVSHNQIDHVACAAISFGWGGWPDKIRQPAVANFSHDNVISDNLIFDYMEILSDGGGVYTQGVQGHSMATGLRVTGNVIHDQIDWGGALKADDGTTYITYSHNVLYNNTYDWDGIHVDYSGRAGKVSHVFDAETIVNNFWQQGNQQGNDKGVTISGNQIISGPEQAPTAIVDNAGLEPAYSSLLSWQRAAAVPNAPQKVTVLYSYHGKVYVTWHSSYAEGSSPVISYTLTVCRGGAGTSLGLCVKPAVAPVVVSSQQYNQSGYGIVSGLKDGKYYDVTITATNATGTSIASVPTTLKPHSRVPGRPSKPTQLRVQTGNGDVRLIWYRPKNDHGVILLSDPSRHRVHHHIARTASGGHVFVLSYLVACSNGPRYPVTGEEPLVNTNTGSWQVYVVGGLQPHHRYRFSVAGVNPSGPGPAARTGWVTPGA